MPSPPLSPPRSLWLSRPSVDLLIGCGAWSIPLLLIYQFLSVRDAAATAMLFYGLTLFCNNPHYMATLVRAYRTETEFRKYHFLTLYVTALVLLTGVIVHRLPFLFPWLFTLYLTWSPWHYTAQNYGLAALFARRAGALPTPGQRRALHGSYVCSYLVWFLSMHSAVGDDSAVLSLGIPLHWASPAQTLLGAGFLCGQLFALHGFSLRTGWRPLLPAATLGLTQALWFLIPPAVQAWRGLSGASSSDTSTPVYYSAGILAFMHCAQYLWITSIYARREALSEKSTSSHPNLNPTSVPAPAWRPLRYWTLLVAGGIALFIPGPWLVSVVFRHDLVESYLIFASLVNLHHFILDGAIWKLRDSRIARLLLGPAPAPDNNSAAPAPPAPPRLWRLLSWLRSPAPLPRALRLVALAALLAVALLDQVQFYLTRRNAPPANLARAASLNPADTRVPLRQARLLLQQGDLPAALAQLRDAIRINPYNLTAQSLLGQLLTQSGDLSAALAHYDRMAQLLRPDLPSLVIGARLDNQAGDTSAALDRLNQALRRRPDSPLLHLNLAETFLLRQQPTEAMRQYEILLDLLPSDPAAKLPADLPPAQATHAILQLAELHRHGGQPARARHALARALPLAGRSGDPALQIETWQAYATLVSETVPVTDSPSLLRAYAATLIALDIHRAHLSGSPAPPALRTLRQSLETRLPDLLSPEKITPRLPSLARDILAE